MDESRVRSGDKLRAVNKVKVNHHSYKNDLNLLIATVILVISVVSISKAQTLENERVNLLIDDPSSNEKNVSKGVLEKARNTKHIPVAMASYAFEYVVGQRISGDELLVSTKKSYIFPIQDVAITLSYPAPSPNPNTHIITAYRLWINQDSKDSAGYQVRGGAFCHNLNLKIVAQGAKAITIEFILYGIDRILLPYGAGYDNNALCNDIVETPLKKIQKPLININVMEYMRPIKK